MAVTEDDFTDPAPYSKTDVKKLFSNYLEHYEFDIEYIRKGKAEIKTVQADWKPYLIKYINGKAKQESE